MTRINLDGIAETVVVRPRVFTVDGKDFPWYISERGPTLTRLEDDLYTVDVDVILIDKDTHEYLPFAYTAPDRSMPYIPVIDGSPFPWLCNGDGYTLTFGHKDVPILHLVFYAYDVDAQGVDVLDKRTNQDSELCAGGYLVKPREQQPSP